MNRNRYFMFDEELGQEVEISQDHYYRAWQNQKKCPKMFGKVKIRREIVQVVMVPNCHSIVKEH